MFSSYHYDSLNRPANEPSLIERRDRDQEARIEQLEEHMIVRKILAKQAQVPV